MGIAEQSILETVKEHLNIPGDVDAFDKEVMSDINAAFFTMYQLGALSSVFEVRDSTSKWSDANIPVGLMGEAQVYVNLKVTMMFDPPTSVQITQSYTNLLNEVEWRLSFSQEVADA